MNFEIILNEKASFAEKVIESYLPGDNKYLETLVHAVNYSMNAGGKRIRPILLMESYRLFGGRGQVCEPFMAAIEMIHTHSLVHDDLPAIDNDEMRRGKPATHKAFGEAVGVLCGDVLLNLAYESALKAFVLGTDAGTVIHALDILAAKTGINGMLGGQSVDVINEKNEVTSLSREELDFIYTNKTAALLEAPLMIGAVLSGAPPKDVELMEKMGRALGLAFQIRDDILDVYGDEKLLGKPVKSDEKNHKTTYVTLFGRDRAEEIVSLHTKEARDCLDKIDGDKEFLSELLSYMTSRDR